MTREAGTLEIETNMVSGTIDLATLADNVVAFDGGGLGGANSASIVCRSRTGAGSVSLEHSVTHQGDADLPVYIRVTQADGNQAWTSPIYLIA